MTNLTISDYQLAMQYRFAINDAAALNSHLLFANASQIAHCKSLMLGVNQ
jgi:hypothetical protein